MLIFVLSIQKREFLVVVIRACVLVMKNGIHYVDFAVYPMMKSRGIFHTITIKGRGCISSPAVGRDPFDGDVG